jgi:hypothetical protein
MVRVSKVGVLSILGWFGHQQGVVGLGGGWVSFQIALMRL